MQRETVWLVWAFSSTPLPRGVPRPMVDGEGETRDSPLASWSLTSMVYALMSGSANYGPVSRIQPVIRSTQLPVPSTEPGRDQTE